MDLRYSLLAGSAASLLRSAAFAVGIALTLAVKLGFQLRLAEVEHWLQPLRLLPPLLDHEHRDRREVELDEIEARLLLERRR